MNRPATRDVSADVSDGRRATGTTAIVLRVLAAAGLAVSAWIHIDLAHLYKSLGDTITQADLFYAQGAVAAAVALWLLVTGMRTAWWAAALVGAGSFAAVMVYRYVDVGAIGPIPNMHDASWLPSPDKAISAVAEAAVVVLWLLYETVSAARARQAARAPVPAGS